MVIKFTCPYCRKALRVKEHLAGKKAQCPACKRPLTVPAGSGGPPQRQADLETLAAAALADGPKTPTPTTKQTTIEFQCYYCDEKVRVSAELAGKQTPCPECRRIVKVPFLEKKEPKDWRNVQARLPAGARRDVGPVPEGAWDTASVGVSREALVEAQAIPQQRRRLTTTQWIKRGTAVAAGILVVGGVAWMVTNYLASSRQNQALAKALQELQTDKLTGEAGAEIHRGAGEYLLRTLNRGSAEEARIHFQQARAAILAAPLAPVQREASLVELALAQIDLGGEKEEVDSETRLTWDDAHKEIRQTLQNESSTEGRGEALRQVTRKLLAKNQGMRAVSLAVLFPEEGPELPAQVGLEMVRAKQEQLAETLANQTLEKLAPQIPPPGGDVKPPSIPPAPSLIALRLLLGKPDKVEAPPIDSEKGWDLVVRIGNVVALAYQGKWDQARERVRMVNTPEDRLPVLMAFADAAEANDQAAAARPELENAFSLVEGEAKNLSASPWQLVRLARAGVKAGMEERVQAAARLVPDLATRGRMQLEVLRGRLAGSKVPADDAWAQIVDANTPSHPLGLELGARHNARHVAAGAVHKTLEGWDGKLQPFGYLGMALGLQDRNH
jgi:hypothetical protein